MFQVPLLLLYRRLEQPLAYEHIDHLGHRPDLGTRFGVVLRVRIALSPPIPVALGVERRRNLPPFHLRIQDYDAVCLRPLVVSAKLGKQVSGMPGAVVGFPALQATMDGDVQLASLPSLQVLGIKT